MTLADGPGAPGGPGDSAVAAARAALGAALAARGPEIIAAWRARIAADPQLTTHRTLPRAQLVDHLPAWLQSLARGLAAGGDGWRKAKAEADQERNAQAHGLQRWQLGFDLREVTREWGALHACLAEEIAGLVQALPAEVAPEARHGLLPEAYQALAGYIAESTSDSTAEYFRLAGIEAAGNVRDLEDALATVREVERRQAELWQQAAHDLRGNLGVVANVAEGIAAQGEADPPRRLPAEFLRILRRNIASLHTLLDDVTELARLQAGEHRRRVPFDAAVELTDLADNVRPLAAERGLGLRLDGPASLPVHGDPVKVRRIAQNLLLNALKYTREGHVTLGWQVNDELPQRWSFRVVDTGPGFNAGPGTPLVAEMKATPGQPSPADPREPHPAHGEGLGLAIVKRLCDLLDASVRVESGPNGSTFEVTLPVDPPGADARA